jgi:hypothetical protein
MFGFHSGSVSAKALYSFVTPSRFKQSSFPVIEIDATASGPKAARRLAQDTTLAFKSWLIASQNASNVPASERVLVEELRAPAGVVVSGGPKKSLPVAAALVIFAASLGVAVLLDRRRMHAAGESLEHPVPVD